jgi:hypothetical protein
MEDKFTPLSRRAWATLKSAGSNVLCAKAPAARMLIGTREERRIVLVVVGKMNDRMNKQEILEEIAGRVAKKLENAQGSNSEQRRWGIYPVKNESNVQYASES